jgi:hypothetical protein
LLFELRAELVLTVAGQPVDDLIDFGLGAAFFLGLGHVKGVDAGHTGFIDSMVVVVHVGRSRSYGFLF